MNYTRSAPPGWIDPGFSGDVTLELSNVATLPIKLWPGMKIGQLCFFRLSCRLDGTHADGPTCGKAMTWKHLT